MKRSICCLILTCIVGVLSLQARTPQEAAQVASRFISQRALPPAQRIQRAASAIQSTQSTVTLVFTQYQMDATTPAVYVFTPNKGNGFVLVSAEDNARAVLGYADYGTLDATNIPANMQFWMQMYADELANVNTTVPALLPGQSVVSRSQRVATNEDNYPVVSPILADVHWGQNKPFNNQCPTISGQKTPTGCVATALAQIMYKHQYPQHGVGSHSYVSTTHGISRSANFEATTYEWAKMLPDYSTSYTTQQANAVATLLSHLGVSCEMDYAPEGSGAYDNIALRNLTTYFDYDKGLQALPKDYLTEKYMLDCIAEDLQAGRPVYVTGSTVNKEGHAFVCDGMQSNGYLHINWGWDGYADGYFAVSALDPEIHGTGGSSSGLAFTQRVMAYTGVRPNIGGDSISVITVDALNRTSSDKIARTDKIHYELPVFYNQGIFTATGHVVGIIYDANDTAIDTIVIGDVSLPSSYYYTNPYTLWCKLDTNLPVGKYSLEIAMLDHNDVCRPIYVKNQGRVRTSMTLTESEIIFGSATPSVSNGLQMADIIQIDGTTQWSVDLYSPAFWDDNPSESEVLIRCVINSNNATSIVGTYTLDMSNSGAEGTIQADAQYAVGYKSACYLYTPDVLHLTFRQGEDGMLHVQCYVEANGEVMQQNRMLSANWYLLREGSYYYYDDYITYDLAAALPASRALAIAQSLPNTNETQMSYFTKGIISTMRNTPDQIAQYQTARFDISDDGQAKNQLYCYNTRWLDNASFVTGNEIQQGDEVVVYGPLQNYQGNTPEIKGYVYSHTAISKYQITNLVVRTQGSTLYFSFESEAPYFHVRVIDSNDEEVLSGIIDFKSVSVDDLVDGTYTLWIRPVDEAQEYYVGAAAEEVFTINTQNVVDYSIYNLNVTTEGSTVRFSFESQAPYFHVKIINANEETIANSIIDFKNVRKENLEDGTYTLWIRPVDEAQEFYIGDAVEIQFEISTAATDVNNMMIQQTIELYDIMGRLIDRKLSNNIREWNVPATGVYVMKTDNETRKVYINQ